MRFSVLQSPSAPFRIRGPDANTFLNGQFTQELRLSPGGIAYGLWLNQKGKVLADSHVLRLSDDEHLVFAAETDPALLRQRLEDYLIADEVTIDDESGAWRGALLWETTPDDWARLGGAEVRPSAPAEFSRVGEAFLFRAWGTSAGWAWAVWPEHASAEWSARLAQAGQAGSSADAAQARIRAQIPQVPIDLGLEDLPNEGGLDRTAISYTKGCYLGQEVMSRLKNLGQVRRRLHVIRGAGAPPAPKTPLFQGDKRVGETRSAAPEGEGFVAHAMLSLVNYTAGEPLQVGAGGAAAEVLPHG
jgi:folate-binding protein YgfZ